MKKLLFTLLGLSCFYVQCIASGYASWNLPSSIPNYLSFTSSTAVCPGLQLAVTFDLDAGLPPSSPDEFRYYIEISEAGVYFSGDNRTAVTSLPITYTTRHFHGTVLVPITRWAFGGVPGFHVGIQHRVYNPVSGTWGGWTNSDDFYPDPLSVYPQFTMIKDNSALDFSVNGLKANNGTPPTIIRCNGEEIKIDNITGTGDATTVQTNLEEGTFDGTTFHPLPARFVSAYYPGWMPWFTLSSGVFVSFWSGYLSTGPTYLAATVIATGPCGSTTKTVIFKVIDSRAFVDFQMQAGNTCATTGTARQVSLPIHDDPSAGSLCIPGWQGASTAGIVSFNTASSSAAVDSFTVRIEEVDAVSGTFLNLVHEETINSGLPLVYPFVTATAGYFNDPSRYATLTASNHTFKAILTVYIGKCTASAFSYFRIAPGNIFLRGSATLASESDQPSLYPNPVAGKVMVDYKGFNGDGSIKFYDLLGKQLMTKMLKANHEEVIDIGGFPSGLYIYKIVSGNKEFNGKINKQ